MFQSIRFTEAYKQMLDALQELDELTQEGRVPLRPEDRKQLRSRLETVAQSMDQMEKAWHATVSTMETKVKQLLLDRMLEDTDDT